jgi:flagellar protein FliS
VHRRAASLYRKVQVESASPPRILLEVYRRIGEDVQQARECMAARDFRGKGKAIDHALALFGQLEEALDHAAAPDLCRNLADAYAFCRGRLLLASARLDPRPLAEVDRVLGPIHEAFEKIIDKPVVVPPPPGR